MQITEIITIAVGGANLIALGVAGFMFFRKPDEDASKDIAVMRAECSDCKDHTAKAIQRIDKTIFTIENNSLKHMEQSLHSLDNRLIEVFTILNERLPKK